ncbi:MAG: permease YjgP/YjgQ family protein [Gemmatimonadetes bacterium]|nr:permease YjgP/YjgQ family protein [Gemmatimonadota bacterium]
MTRIGGPLDRYVFAEWLKIFFSTALGLPILLVIIDLTEKIQGYLNRDIPPADIALSYVYWMPQSMFLALPASVLFATVFSIGTFTRHSEVTAAKASGISFYRLIAPILFGAVLASGLDLVVGELVPITEARRIDLLGESKIGSGMQRTNFAYAAEYGRVYKALALDITQSSLDRLQIERKGNGKDYFTVVVSTTGAKYSGVNKKWTMAQGQMHVMNDTSSFNIGFERAIDMRMTEGPPDLMAKPRDPAELRYAELTQFIKSLERSGGDANLLRVERALKIAIPVTCLVIALFGAPLATSTQRGGTAYGIGVSLATTVTFLMLIQLTKAIGKGGVLAPDIAAWIPNALFAVVGLILLFRVRT